MSPAVDATAKDHISQMKSANAAQTEAKAHEYEHLTSVPTVQPVPITNRLDAEAAKKYKPNLPGGFEEYKRLHKESLENPAKFYHERAQLLSWFKPYDQVYICLLYTSRCV